MKYKIKVNWSENLQSRYHTIERVIEQADFDPNIKVLNRMLATGEITSYKVSKEPDCTCFTCDDVDCKETIEKSEVKSMGDVLRSCIN